MGIQIIRRLTTVFCSICRKSATIRRAERKAVSPEVIGAAITPRNATQPQSALDMMQFIYLWLPLIFDVLIMFVLSRMNVEDANKKLKAEKGIAADEVTDASDIN